MLNVRSKLFLTLAVTMMSFSGLTHDLQQPTQPNNPIATPIYQLFQGMREHDKTKILAQFTATAILDRVNNKGILTNTDIKEFAQNVANSKAYLDEHLLKITILQQGELASVWTPFAFYLDNQLSHCGSNSFQLVKQNGEWKIHYLIDITYRGDCVEFIQKHAQ